MLRRRRNHKSRHGWRAPFVRPVAAGLAVLFVSAHAQQAAAFHIEGARVSLSPKAVKDPVDLGDIAGPLAAANGKPDVRERLAAIFAPLRSARTKRAAFAWFIARSASVGTDGPAAFHALAAADVTAPAALIQAALFAISRGARAADLIAAAGVVGVGPNVEVQNAT